MPNVANPLEYLRAKVWAHLLVRGIYPRSAYALAMAIDGGPYRRGRWQKYLNGTSRALPYNGNDPVQAATEKFPGSEQPFDSAIWHILGGGRISVEECYSELARLGPDMHFIFLSGKGADNFEAGLEPRDLGEIARLLVEFPTFDALQSLILLVAMADAVEDVIFRNDVCELYHVMVPLFVERGDIPFCDEMLTEVDKITRYRFRAALNDPFEVDHPWTAIISQELPRSDLLTYVSPSRKPRLNEPFKRIDRRKETDAKG